MPSPTTKELNIVMSALKDHMNEKFEDVNGGIEELVTQAKYTNGKVRSLQLKFAFAMGAVAVLMSFVIPMGVYIWNQRTNVETAVTNSLERKLAEYEIRVVP